jgi:photosystem II stability/assembly factor-like uncharacterized protein
MPTRPRPEIPLLTVMVLAGAAATAAAQAAERRAGERKASARAADERRTPAPPVEDDEGPLAELEWRSIGPVNMSGRVADVEGVPGNPRVVYVGSASGGVWKTEDAGLSFKPVFDEQPVASIGDIALAPSNPEVVYVGSGESNARNSVSSGNGVYKSTDGGRSFRHVGLADTRHVSRVLVHPTDPDLVYVGALGHLFGPNPERGVFRSRDGGASWQKVLYLDDRHGVADMDMSPANPNLLFAALWHFDRKPWTHTSGSEQGGVWRSVDGGDTWKKLTKGLPKLMGRIGVKVAPADPKVVYVIAESHEGTLFRSDDGGDSFSKVSDKPEIVSRGLYYTDLRVHPTNPDVVFAVASLLQKSIDGGRSFERISRTTHIDFHALWIDPLDPARMWQGQDGGVAVSYDGGKAWEPVRNLPIAQFYQVQADNREPFYYLGGGLQDNGTWWGPSRTREPGGILEDDWRMPSFGDAYHVVIHPDDPDLMISESQGGNIMRTDLRTRQQVDIGPQPKRNDGGPASGLRYRFNWNSPIVASPHDGRTVYFAGNFVFRSRDFGDSWEAISPDLTTNDPEKQKDAGGPVWKENTTAEYHCTIISFAESKAQKGVLWAGTDDGRLQLSRDDGASWSDVAANVPGVPAFSPVSHVEPSRRDPATAWVAFDRHMFDDPAPYVFKTTDFGRSWTRLTAGLPPQGFVWVVRQDPRNPQLLWAGTELGLYASHDEGRSWRRLHLKNLPTVAVHDILVHPRDNDLILGTHGRALWVFDDAQPLQQWDPAAPLQAQLFDVRPALRFPVRFTRYGLGDKQYRAPNPPAGALITYALPERMAPEPAARAKGEGGASAQAGEAGKKPERVKLEILDASGKLVRSLKKLGLEKGLNRVAWDLHHNPPFPRKEGEERAPEFGPPPGGPYALPGTYAARLTVDGKAYEKPVVVRVDPLVRAAPAALAAQFEMAEALAGLRSEVNRALRALDALAGQLDERRKLAKQLGRGPEGELETQLAKVEGQLKEIAGLLARPEGQPNYASGPRLGEQLRALTGDVDSAFAAPTEPQRELFRELKQEVEKALAREEAFRKDGLAALNQELAKSELPPIAAPRPRS